MFYTLFAIEKILVFIPKLCLGNLILVISMCILLFLGEMFKDQILSWCYSITLVDFNVIVEGWTPPNIL